MKKLLILLIIVAIFSGCTRRQARVIGEWQGGIQREYDVTSSRSQIYSYEYFYDKLAAIRGAANSLQFLDPELDRIEYNGIRMNIAQWVAEYNEDARKDEGMARYKARGLPDTLYLNDYIK